MHLARTVTHSTVEECMRRMSAREFQYWAAEYKLRPWGDDWLQAGTIAAASVAPWTKRRVKAEQFIPTPRSSGRRDPREIEIQMRSWAAQHNARFEREQRQPRITAAPTPIGNRRRPKRRKR